MMHCRAWTHTGAWREKERKIHRELEVKCPPAMMWLLSHPIRLSESKICAVVTMQTREHYHKHYTHPHTQVHTSCFFYDGENFPSTFIFLFIYWKCCYTLAKKCCINSLKKSQSCRNSYITCLYWHLIIWMHFCSMKVWTSLFFFKKKLQLCFIKITAMNTFSYLSTICLLLLVEVI